MRFRAEQVSEAENRRVAPTRRAAATVRSGYPVKGAG